MRAVIHVGPHKTGTTSFQVACRAAYQALLDEGVLYPAGGLSGGKKASPFCHMEVANALKEGRSDEVYRYLESCKSEASRCGADTVLLSSEEFSSLVWTEGALAKLEVVLASIFELHDYVLVLRRIRDSFPSILRQLLTHFNVDLFNQVSLDQKLESVALVLDRLIIETAPWTRTIGFDELRSGNFAWNLLRFCLNDDQRATRIELTDIKANASDDVAKGIFDLITPLFRALIAINHGHANPYGVVVQSELARLFNRKKMGDLLQENVSGEDISALVSRGLSNVSSIVVDRNREYIAGKYPILTKLGVLE